MLHPGKGGEKRKENSTSSSAAREPWIGSDITQAGWTERQKFVLEKNYDLLQFFSGNNKVFAPRS